MSGEVRIHPHAIERATLRGASVAEIVETVTLGEAFPAKHGRTGFRRNFTGTFAWREREFDNKQLEVYAVLENGHWLAITVIVKFY